MHLRDIIELLISEKVDRVENFEWIKQLKYYWDEQIEDCLIK